MFGVLAGQRALVTGGGSGLGRSISLSLSDAGAEVAVLDVNLDAAEAVAREIRAASGNAFAVVASVGDEIAVSAAFQVINERWAGIDILVNNAGINMNKPSLELSMAEWRRTININLDGTFYCCWEAARLMKDQRKGSIVNISSIYGLVAAPNRAAYCASKGAIVMLTKSLAVEWAEFGIRVNAISPGYAQTPAILGLAAEGRVDLERLINRTPQKRLGEPEEMANAVLYFCEPRSQHITGQVLAVDGGWTAYGYI